jgi:hypothetical protein
MKKLLRNNFWIVGVITGAIGGFLYWKFIGCGSGTCLITSHPVNSTIYFSVMGGLFLSLFQPGKKKSEVGKH